LGLIPLTKFLPKCRRDALFFLKGAQPEASLIESWPENVKLNVAEVHLFIYMRKKKIKMERTRGCWIPKA
jgi:hypothetical protein